ncbi:MAG TPA: hypothetical protein VK581_12270 [Chthoniobacterales bacterium]|nr:hypothetical protein [Chthoniobacterales bacterium]
MSVNYFEFCPLRIGTGEIAVLGEVPSSGAMMNWVGPGVSL